MYLYNGFVFCLLKINDHTLYVYDFLLYFKQNINKLKKSIMYFIILHYLVLFFLKPHN